VRGSEADRFVTIRRLDLADPTWDVDQEALLLTPAERARADLGVPAVRRRRVLLRAALRRVLGELLDLPADGVHLETTDGRPHLPGPSPFALSCSASGDVGLVAVAGVPVGVDVQRHDPEEARQAFGEDWLDDAERAALARLPDPARLVAVTRAWTQKEAVLKGLGVGLRRPPGSIGTPVRASGRVGAWALAPVAVPVGYVATVALRTQGPPGAVRTTDLGPTGGLVDPRSSGSFFSRRPLPAPPAARCTPPPCTAAGGRRPPRSCCSG
jgi:4'-phosphopantetheinyl transferase